MEEHKSNDVQKNTGKGGMKGKTKATKMAARQRTLTFTEEERLFMKHMKEGHRGGLDIFGQF